MTICPKMKGAKCAESYCDMWDLEKKRCSEAIVNEKKSELLSLLIKKLSKQQGNEKLRTEIIKGLDRVLH